MRKILVAGIAVAALMALTGAVAAAEVEVKMLNKGSDGKPMVFEPALVKIAPGDTVRFVATDKSHNAESISGMLPEGATPFKGKTNQDVTVTFTNPGVYGVKCMPHYGMGMVALVVVGEPTNQAAASAVNHPGNARKVFAELFARLSTQAATK